MKGLGDNVWLPWSGCRFCGCSSTVLMERLRSRIWSRSLILGALGGPLHGLGATWWHRCPENNGSAREHLPTHYFLPWILMRLVFAWCWLPNFIHSQFFENHKLFRMRLIYPRRSPNWIRNPLAKFYAGASGEKGKGRGGTRESKQQMWKSGKKKILKRSRKGIEKINIFLLN